MFFGSDNKNNYSKYIFLNYYLPFDQSLVSIKSALFKNRNYLLAKNYQDIDWLTQKIIKNNRDRIFFVILDFSLFNYNQIAEIIEALKGKEAKILFVDFDGSNKVFRKKEIIFKNTPILYFWGFHNDINKIR